MMGAVNREQICELLDAANSTLRDLADHMDADVDVGACATVDIAAVMLLSVKSQCSVMDPRAITHSVALAYWSLEYLIDVGFCADNQHTLHLRTYDRRLFDAALGELGRVLSELEGLEASYQLESAERGRR